MATRPGSARKPARKPAARRARKPAASQPPTLTRAHLSGFFVGALAGLLAGAGGLAYLTRDPGGPQAPVAEVAAAEDRAGNRPRFDFYTVLPNQRLDLTSDVEPAAMADAVGADPTTATRYLLQAGSFRDPADADRRKGELALLGLISTVEASDSDNGRWYRVFVGPFDTRSAMAQARSLTAQAAIDTLVLKRNPGN